MMRPQMGFGGGLMMQPTPSSNLNGPDRGSNLKEVTKIRKSFPETWLWTNKTTGYFSLLTLSLYVQPFFINAHLSCLTYYYSLCFLLS